MLQEQADDEWDNETDEVQSGQVHQDLVGGLELHIYELLDRTTVKELCIALLAVDQVRQKQSIHFIELAAIFSL